MLIAQIEPDHFEVEGARLVGFLEAEQIVIEVPAALHVRDDDGTMIDLRKLRRHYDVPT